MSRGPVKIHKYDQSWSIQFEKYKEELTDILEQFNKIEHIGSTSIEGMGAKPIIDILITVDQLDDADQNVSKLVELGYEYHKDQEEDFPFRRYLVLKQNGNHKIHIHMVPDDHEFVREHLAFRDYLRKHSDVRDEYHLLKTRLANKYRDDREGYQNAKAVFIESITDLALDE